ncbi:hypothetical protein NG774_09655 [Aliarcobacter cryaerophilus]|uniref:type III-A CRISPR-associated RAMP protein Csm4 n=1 Tax=Aliarcobacter cryaerophilus TaxID=28198 RepID=UPI003DA3DC91
MTLYKTTINPISKFATTLKGDTLFGQICWAIRYSFGEQKLEELLGTYETSPFLIVSDGFAKGFLPKPIAPSFILKESLETKKENRKKVWLKLEDLQNLEFHLAKTDEEVFNIDKDDVVVKNSINYKTFTTDDSGKFSPYSLIEKTISKKDIYFLLDESKFKLEELEKSFKLLSQMGFGKDSSIGKGIFTFTSFEKVELKNIETNSYFTLSPSIISEQNIKNSFYEPFTRFGKHSSNVDIKNIFKKPLLLANSAAVVIFENNIEKSYIGRAIKGHSSFEKTVHQGYSIVIPIKELNYENI